MKTKTAAEILAPYVELVLADVEVVQRHNALMAMEEYARQEAIAYAAWLSNQVTTGRTFKKLWTDYMNSKN